MTRRERVPAPRDQTATPFSVVLGRFCDATGALGAALVDFQGETVDYAGPMDPYAIRVAAAEWRLVLDLVLVRRALRLAQTVSLVVRADRASFAAVPLGEGYALVVCLPVRCFSVSPRALSEVVRDLCREGGIAAPAAWQDARWLRVEVRAAPGPMGRPLELWHSGRWWRLEILGRYVPEALGRRELGFRARLEVGSDLTLVREPRGVWYADGLPDV